VRAFADFFEPVYYRGIAMELTDNINIKQFKPLTPPDMLKADHPETEVAAHLVAVAPSGRKDPSSG